MGVAILHTRVILNLHLEICMLFGMKLSFEKGLQLRVGNHEVGIDLPQVAKEAIDDFSPLTYTDHGEEKPKDQ